MVVGPWLEEPEVMAISAAALAVRVLKKGSGDLAVVGGWWGGAEACFLEPGVVEVVPPRVALRLAMDGFPRVVLPSKVLRLETDGLPTEMSSV